MSVTLPETLKDVRREARPYPTWLLPKEGTALGLFAAGFLGWNDVIWFEQAGLQTTCVDLDGDRLFQMSTIYPGGWEFHVQDAWEFSEHAARQQRTWDVVSVDPFTGDAGDRAADTIYLWTSLARRLVTLTVTSRTHLNIPEGWTASYFPRSSTVAWLVLTHK